MLQYFWWSGAAIVEEGNVLCHVARDRVLPCRKAAPLSISTIPPKSPALRAEGELCPAQVPLSLSPALHYTPPRFSCGARIPDR